MKKYSFTGETKVVFGIKLKKIKAVISFGFIEKGEYGGWIEKEENLDQSGNAWVYGDAWVSGNARVSGDAWVYGNAWVTKNVINLIASCEFNVTAYCDFVQIGCKNHKIKTWERIFKEGQYITLCKNEESYLQCKDAFEFCKKALEYQNKSS